MRLLKVVLSVMVCSSLVAACTGPVHPSGESATAKPSSESSADNNSASRSDWYISNNEALVKKLDECKQLPRDGAGDHECDAASEAFIRWYQASQNMK